MGEKDLGDTEYNFPAEFVVFNDTHFMAKVF